MQTDSPEPALLRRPLIDATMTREGVDEGAQTRLSAWLSSHCPCPLLTVVGGVVFWVGFSRRKFVLSRIRGVVKWEEGRKGAKVITEIRKRQPW